MRIISFDARIYSLDVRINYHAVRIVCNAVTKCFIPSKKILLQAGVDIIPDGTVSLITHFPEFGIYHIQITVPVFQHIPWIKVGNNNLTICKGCFIYLLKIKS